MSKLLNRPLKAFTMYALLILAGSIPVYYWVVDRIWLNELDDHNRIVQQQVEKRFNRNEVSGQQLDDMLRVWNTMQPGTTLQPAGAAGTGKDSVYTVTRQLDGETDRFRGLAATITINGNAYRLTVETNVEEADETILAIALVTTGFFALLVLGFILLNRRIAARAWRPFHTTLRKLKDFDLAKDGAISFDKSGIEEFEELNSTLDKLIQKNVSAYAQQKTFIENASHELQTPLAVLKSKLDLLLQNKDLTTGQLQLLDALELPLLKISRINKNLLLLAKIENSQFSETGPVNLVTVLDESRQLLADYIEEKELAFTLAADDALLVSCNTFLLEILVNNLFTNAIRHTPRGGTVHISCRNKALVFTNSGAAALDAGSLFRRFSIAAAETTTSSGLGLAIVKEICNRYGWHISYTFKNNLHIFSISFG